MAYDSSRPTVRSRIIDNIKSTLEGIYPSNGYVTELGPDLNRVAVYDGKIVTFNSRPCVAIVPMQDERDDSTNHTVEITQRFTLTLATQGTSAEGSTWREQLDRLIAEVQHALTRDPQRGVYDDDRPNARTTQIIGAILNDSTHNDLVGNAQIDFLVEFAHPYDDPTTSI